MQHTSAQVDTELARQYLFKLCKHFARKITVDFDRDHGMAHFPVGTCEFTADDKQLTFMLSAMESGQLAQLQSVIEHHLQLMRRAPDPALTWTVR